MRTLTKYYSGDQVNEDGVDGACSKHGTDEKCIHIFILNAEGKKPLGS